MRIGFAVQITSTNIILTKPSNCESKTSTHYNILYLHDAPLEFSGVGANKCFQRNNGC